MLLVRKVLVLGLLLLVGFRVTNISLYFDLPLTELPNTDYGLLLRRRGPLQPIRMRRNDVS